MYLIYCKKIPSDDEIARYLLDDHSAGSFCMIAKRGKTLLANVSSPIFLLQQSVDVGETVEYFPCDLSVGKDALVPIVLQGAGADEEPFADFSPREVDFSSKQRTMCLGYFFQSLCHLLDARDELFHLGRFFVYDFVFHSHCIFRFDFSRKASTSSRL